MDHQYDIGDRVTVLRTADDNSAGRRGTVTGINKGGTVDVHLDHEPFQHPLPYATDEITREETR